MQLCHHVSMLLLRPPILPWLPSHHATNMAFNFPAYQWNSLYILCVLHISTIKYGRKEKLKKEKKEGMGSFGWMGGRYGMLAA